MSGKFEKFCKIYLIIQIDYSGGCATTPENGLGRASINVRGKSTGTEEREGERERERERACVLFLHLGLDDNERERESLVFSAVPLFLLFRPFHRGFPGGF